MVLEVSQTINNIHILFIFYRYDRRQWFGVILSAQLDGVRKGTLYKVSCPSPHLQMHLYIKHRSTHMTHQHSCNRKCVLDISNWATNLCQIIVEQSRKKKQNYHCILLKRASEKMLGQLDCLTFKQNLKFVLG